MNRIEFLANLDKYKGEDHSAFLQHYGILGQKWGQRRWQNPDGTFNTEGKIRYFGSEGNKKAREIVKKDLESKGYEEVTPEFNYNIPKKYEQYRDALHAEVSRQLIDVIKSNQGLNIPDDQKIPKKVNVNVDDNGHFKIDFEYDDSNQKIGSMLSFSRKVKESANKGVIANHHRNKMIEDILANRDKYDAVNLSEDEIKDIAQKIQFPGGNGDWVHDAQQQFKRESLKLQLEKALNTKFGSQNDQKIGGLFSKKDNGPEVDPIKLKNMGYLPGIDEPIIFTDKKGTYDFGDVKKNYDTNLSRFISKKDIPIAKKYRDDIEKMFDKFTGLTQEELDEGRKMLNDITDEHERKVVEKCLAVMCGSQYTLKPGEGMEIRFTGKPGKGQKEEVSEDLFTKKNEKGRSETADKMEDAAKKFREDGDKELADETENTAKEMRDATKITPDRKNMTKEEKKELRNAANRCWKMVNKNGWAAWFLFGMPGYAINCALNWGLIKEAAKREGIDGKSKEWSAADWNKITDSIMDRYPRKYKREIAKRDAERNQSQK